MFDRPNSLKIKAKGFFSARLTETIFSGSVIEAWGEVETSDGKTWKLLFHLHPEDDLSSGDQVEFDILPQFTAVIQV